MRSFVVWLRCLKLPYVIIRGIVQSAILHHQLLPILTLSLPIHSMLLRYFIPIVITFMNGRNDHDGANDENINNNSQSYRHHDNLDTSMLSFIWNCCFFVHWNLVWIGYVFLIMLYRHSIRVIFNRQIPILVSDSLAKGINEEFPFWKSFEVHLNMMRPLEALFRFATARFRVLPDVLILGEVRCGTTSLCHMLAELQPACHTPFSMWKHPELDHKETFYFVGHYLGIVDPKYYRMCFPLKITKWFHTKVLRRPFFTFDGSAQYLTSPTAPYLIAKAYKVANLNPPVLIACVRDPVSQAISWWRYENNAIQWGEGMGLSKWNTQLRSSCYPPRTIVEATKDSFRGEYDIFYENKLVNSMIQSLSQQIIFKLPDQMITWPGGQLSGIGRNGFYCKNIVSYNTVFNDVFGTKDKKYVNVVSLEDFASKSTLMSVLEKAFTDNDALAQVVSWHFYQQDTHLIPGTLKLQLSFTEYSNGDESDDENTVHRNAGAALLDVSKEPTKDEIKVLTRFFAKDVIQLEEYSERKFSQWRKP